MRFTRALDILKTLDGEGPIRAFAWERAWLARRDLLSGAFVNPQNPLRRIPGLRYHRLPKLLFSSWREESMKIATSADAVQVGDTGLRLRAFFSADKSTLKVVREDSHYGPATVRELALRADIAGHGLKIPRVDGQETKNGFLFVREQMVEGRSFNVRCDRTLFCPQIVDPLAAFYERSGISFMPLSDALGPMAGFIAQQGTALSKLLEKNPQVAVSLCHNDVVSSNLAVTKEGVYFLDWGFAIQSLCGRDFVRIGRKYLRYPDIREHLRAKISRLQKGAMSLNEMLAVQQAWIDYIKVHGARTDTAALDRMSAAGP